MGRAVCLHWDVSSGVDSWDQQTSFPLRCNTGIAIVLLLVDDCAQMHQAFECPIALSAIVEWVS